MSINAGGKPASTERQQRMTSATQKTTMYYDGGCPICMRGVRHWRKLDWAGRIAWVDLIEQPGALEAEGISFADAMDVLHVRRRDGSLVAGMPAFAALWSELPVYRWLAMMLSPQWMMTLADRIYRVTHRDRYARRCRDGACSVAEGPRIGRRG
jgi:predicted DCC family thiol-disulfide oxidoreductase YuxK